MNKKIKTNTHPKAIEIKHLSWHPKSSPRAILSDVSCRIEKGYIYGIIGPNGSGKTSLMRHMLRLLPVSEDKIFLDDCDIRAYRRKALAQTCSYVAQKIQDAFSYTVYDAVAMGAYPWRKTFGDPESSARLAIQNAFLITRTENLKDKPFHVLSGGETQRVMIARAIAQKSPWMFLDEPVSHLDIPHQIDILNMLVEMKKKQDKTIICVLHDINLASIFCDRIILMKEGKIIDYGDKNVMLTPENLRRVYDMSFRVFDHPDKDAQVFVPMMKNPENL